MHRRQFLATGTALLTVPLAGCGHPPVVLDLEAATAADIADEVSMTLEPGSEGDAVVRTARENGSATRRGRTELFDGAAIVSLDGTFYEVSETRLASSEVTVYEVLIDFDPEETTARLGEIAYDDLPAADRQRLDPIVTQDDPPAQDGYDVGVAYGTAAEVGNRSVFVPERQYDIIVHEGERYRVAVDSRTASEAEYRYEVSEVASSVDAFADRIRERYLFVLAGLSEAEREVVVQAIEEGYFRDDDAFRSVIDRLREREGLRVEDFYGTWLLEYDGVEYLAYAEW